MPSVRSRLVRAKVRSTENGGVGPGADSGVLAGRGRTRPAGTGTAGTSVVTVLDPNGTQRTVTVQTGASGDGKTQILSGVTEGQQVVLPATP